MKRREFVGLVASAAWPLAARAQQQGGGLRRLGVLAGYATNDPLGQMLATILPQGLAALGWSEGQNIHIDWRWASGDPKLYESHAAELVALRPDVLVAQSSPAVQTLRRSTNTIPTVFIMITDPLGQGFVNNLAHPPALAIMIRRSPANGWGCSNKSSRPSPALHCSTILLPRLLPISFYRRSNRPPARLR